MGSAAKVIRGQVRQVVQEILQEVLSEELVAALEKKLTETQNIRLTAVEDFVKPEIEKMNKRSKEIHGYLVREVAVNIANKLHNSNITMLAWQRLMGTRTQKIATTVAALIDPESPLSQEQEQQLMKDLTAFQWEGEAFDKELDETKLVINAELDEKAIKAQQADIQAAEAQKKMREELEAAKQAEQPAPATEPNPGDAPPAEPAPVTDSQESQ